jgi:hypothetical protein
VAGRRTRCSAAASFSLFAATFLFVDGGPSTFLSDFGADAAMFIPFFDVMRFALLF